MALNGTPAGLSPGDVHRYNDVEVADGVLTAETTERSQGDRHPEGNGGGVLGIITE